MKLLLILTLLFPIASPVQADDHYCDEIWAVMQDAVREGTLTYKEAASIFGRCNVDQFSEYPLLPTGSFSSKCSL